jgi:hypothetical protein
MPKLAEEMKVYGRAYESSKTPYDSTGTEEVPSRGVHKESKTTHSAWSSDYSANGLPNADFIKMIYRLEPYLKLAVLELRTNVFAVRGTSGIGVANAIRMLNLDIDFVMVRKEEEGHHGTQVEVITRRNLKFGTYIFLDDFVASGATQRAVQKALPDARMVGQVLYRSLRGDFSLVGHKLRWLNDNCYPTLA